MSSSIITAFVSSLIYAPGAFYFYPWKPLVQFVFGDPYPVGFKFFRRDHSDPTNVALHFVGLVWQVLGNFGLLGALDAQAFGTTSSLGRLRPLSFLSATLWTGVLLLSPAPWPVSVLSAVIIFGAFEVSAVLGPHELEVGCAAAFVAVLLATYSLRGKRVAHLLSGLALTSSYFGLAFGASAAASRWRGTFAGEGYDRKLNAALVVLMLLIGMLPKPMIPATVAGVLLVRIVGELTHQDILLYWGIAFLAQLSQGVSHKVTRQEATLLNHEKDDSHTRRAKLAFEISHVCYFPNLLLHVCYEQLVSGTSFATTVATARATKKSSMGKKK